jgi:D-sedoheptulose 7-phosphate isomerase
MKENVERYFRNLKDVIDSVRVIDGDGGLFNISEGIEMASEMVLTLTDIDKKLMFIGNGASAAISSHMAADFLKNGGLEAIAFNEGPLLTCMGNDYGYQHVFEKPIERMAHSGDILVAISSSGKSENIILGAAAARLKGCRIITLSGFEPHNPLLYLGDINFYVSSNMYGIVEVIHHAICHCVLDTLVHMKNPGI